jgi:hypothetical protein
LPKEGLRGKFLKAFVVEKYYLGVNGRKSLFTAKALRVREGREEKKQGKTKGAGRLGAGPFTSREVNPVRAAETAAYCEA